MLCGPVQIDGDKVLYAIFALQTVFFDRLQSPKLEIDVFECTFIFKSFLDSKFPGISDSLSSQVFHRREP